MSKLRKAIRAHLQQGPGDRRSAGQMLATALDVLDEARQCLGVSISDLRRRVRALETSSDPEPRLAALESWRRRMGRQEALVNKRVTSNRLVAADHTRFVPSGLINTALVNGAFVAICTVGY